MVILNFLKILMYTCKFYAFFINLSDDYLCEITNQRQNIFSINGNSKPGKPEVDSQSEPVMSDRDLVMALTEIVSIFVSEINILIKIFFQSMM